MSKKKLTLKKAVKKFSIIFNEEKESNRLFREALSDITDKVIEHNGKKYSLRKILDSDESWEKYLRGSEKFKAMVELGVQMQLCQLDQLDLIRKHYA